MRSPTESTTSAYGNADVLRLLRDLAHDLDDVAVRVEDAQLHVGAVAAAQDCLDAGKLPLGAELARVRLDEPHRSPDRLRDRHAIPASGLQVHHGGLEPVPRRQPLVLSREDAVERRDLLAGVEAFRVVLDEGLAERRARNDAA